MHGYYLGGKHQVQKEEVLDHLANSVELDSILDGIAFDRGLQQEAWDEEEIRNEISDWATSRTTLNRGALVTRRNDFSWTINALVTNEFVNNGLTDPDDGDADEEAARDADGQRAAVEGGSKPEPQNAKEFNALREEYRNSWGMAADFLLDRDLQKRLRVIYLTLAPLEREYYDDVKKQQKGQKELARWAAHRAAGDSTVVAETLQLLHNPVLFEQLSMASSDENDASLEDPWVKEEAALCDMVFDMVTEVAAARVWSQAMFRVMMPQLCAGVLHEDAAVATRLCNFMNRLTEAALEAEKVVGNQALTACLNDMAWNQSQAARELMKIGKDCQWTPADNTLVEFAFRLYAGPHSTKFILEDQFNHLQHLSRLQTKGRSHMAKPSQYFYTATSPILSTAHLPGPKVAFASFQQCLQVAGRRRSDMEAKQKQLALYKPGQHKVPEALGTKKQILGLTRTWKAAGYRSNRVAAAATMLVLTGQQNSWQHIARAWSGCLFMKGKIFHNTEQDSYVLSLGFFSWGAQAAKLDYFVFTADTKTRWVFNFSLAESIWQAVPFRVLPPCCNRNSSKGATLMRTGANEDLLAHGVRHGIFLTVPELKQIYLANRWPFPGSRKPDFVQDLIQRLHPGASEEMREAMTAGLMGAAARKRKVRTTTTEAVDQDECPEELLEVISGLDPENADAAKGVRKACVEQLLERQKQRLKEELKPGRSDPAATERTSHGQGGWQKQNFTPPELRDLLPPTTKTCWIKRQIGAKQYAGFYDRAQSILVVSSFDNTLFSLMFLGFPNETQ
ncbi:unnamed protein product [Symbiodinium sp. CCMP2592]|nr:unnamed protein product [Symbiodinium sp. CCMP2592]